MLAPTEGGEGLNFAKQKIGERLTTPQSRCTRANRLRAIRESPLQSRTIISKMIGYIKMNASRAIRQHYGDVVVWQRGYHDHVIRNQEDYVALAEYIQTNPIRWELDKLYTEK